MARNRKYRTAAARFGPAIKAFVLCLIIGGSGIGYVWQKNQIGELGKQITQREFRLRALEDQNGKIKRQIAEWTTVDFLKTKIRNLGLVEPTQAQIWQLTEPAREPAKAQTGPQFALQERNGSH